MRIRRALVNDNMLNADVLNHRIVENGVEYIQVHPTFFLRVLLEFVPFTLYAVVSQI